MNISFNISSPTTGLSQTSDTQQTQQTQQSNKTLTVSITSGTQGTSSTTTSGPLTLTYPLIGPEDLALNEVTQQLKNLDLHALKGMNLTAAVLILSQSMGELAAAMTKGGKEFVEKNSNSLTKQLDNFEAQAKKAETQLFDMINSSSYPDFAEFLGKMLVAAQELRELAGKAKHQMVMGQYENVLDQAKQMEIAAQKNYESTMKEIAAARTEAIASIVAGSVSIAATAVGGGIGSGSSAGGIMGAQVGSGIGQSMGQIVTGIGGVISAEQKQDAAALKLEADMAGVVQKKMEATQKLLQEADSISEELMNIGKTLADMVLKLYQDFLSSQNQIVQRSNI